MCDGSVVEVFRVNNPEEGEGQLELEEGSDILLCSI